MLIAIPSGHATRDASRPVIPTPTREETTSEADWGVIATSAQATEVATPAMPYWSGASCRAMTYVAPAVSTLFAAESAAVHAVPDTVLTRMLGDVGILIHG